MRASSHVRSTTFCTFLRDSDCRLYVSGRGHGGRRTRPSSCNRLKNFQNRPGNPPRAKHLCVSYRLAISRERGPAATRDATNSLLPLSLHFRRVRGKERFRPSNTPRNIVQYSSRLHQTEARRLRRVLTKKLLDADRRSTYLRNSVFIVHHAVGDGSTVFAKAD